MKHIKYILMTSILFLSTAVSPIIVMADEHLPEVSGEVRKVKPKTGKITIRHEPIPNLDMPGMTMVFRTEEGTDISQYKKGDKVSFTVIEKNGKMMIVTIEKTE